MIIVPLISPRYCEDCISSRKAAWSGRTRRREVQPPREPRLGWFQPLDCFLSAAWIPTIVTLAGDSFPFF